MIIHVARLTFSQGRKLRFERCRHFAWRNLFDSRCCPRVAWNTAEAHSR